MIATCLPKKLPPGIEIDTREVSLREFSLSHRDFCALPLAIARPISYEQIERVIKWARRHSVALVPVSSSSARRSRADTALSVPAVVLDLSRMRRVIHADLRDEIAVIEPGIDFVECDEMLEAFGLRSIKPLLPKPGKSVLATFLEREPPIGPNVHWDTTDPLASLGIVFGSGETFRTGGAAVPGTLEENLARGNRQMMASGPLMTDYTRVVLGSQGTLGVVGWASIYCEPVPVLEEPYLFAAAELGNLIELTRLLSLQQLGLHFFIQNAVQLAASIAEDAEDFADLRRAQGDEPQWYLYVNLAAGEHLPEQHLAWQRAALLKLVEQVGAQSLANTRGACWAARLASRLQRAPDQHYKTVPSAEYREVFCQCALSKAPSLIVRVSELAKSFGSPASRLLLATYVQPTIQGVSCHLEFNLFFSSQMAELAAQFEAAAVAALAEAGGFFGRPYGNWARVAYEQDSQIVPYLRKVKELFDPVGILNPGKLCF